ncbi:hypothetical protein [Bacteroides sp.]|uniref:hypothetical protein n=1 Tax=Bacteroides sp. TaxID=29523 RepID=UPI002A80B7E7|nr:hypothetical protein [Bacteroides sp.]
MLWTRACASGLSQLCHYVVTVVPLRWHNSASGLALPVISRKGNKDSNERLSMRLSKEPAEPST